MASVADVGGCSSVAGLYGYVSGMCGSKVGDGGLLGVRVN